MLRRLVIRIYRSAWYRRWEDIDQNSLGRLWRWAKSLARA